MIQKCYVEYRVIRRQAHNVGHNLESLEVMAGIVEIRGLDRFHLFLCHTLQWSPSGRL